MKKIMLDTNFLLIPYQFNVDIFSEICRIMHQKYSLFILDKTKDELEIIINNQKGKNKDAAKFALKFISVKKIKIIKTDSGNTDDLILKGSIEKDFIVATQDKDLKRKLINQGTSVIVLRQKKTLMLMNDRGFS